MSEFLLYHARSSGTGPEMARVLGIEGGTELYERVDILIRWGSQAQVRYKPGLVVNSKNAIAKASNKMVALKELGDKGVLVPDHGDIEGGRYHFGVSDAPLVGRPIQHHGGNGFQLCLNAGDVERAIENGAEYFMKYVPNNEEWRAHIVGEELIMAQLKCAGEGGVGNMYCRNTQHGWVLNRRSSPPDWVKNVGVSAIKALGLDFGAVDMCRGNDSRMYVFEVNTAPGLEGDKLAVYARAIARMVGLEVGEEVEEEVEEEEEEV